MNRVPSLAAVICAMALMFALPTSEVHASGWYHPHAAYSYSYYPGSYTTGYHSLVATYTPYYYAGGIYPVYGSYYPAAAYSAYYAPALYPSHFRPSYNYYYSYPYSVGYYTPWSGVSSPSSAYYGSYHGSYGYGGYGYPSYGCHW